MITKENIKQSAIDLGTNLCGIAPIERFDKAPKGFHPKDIFPDAKSVVVIAKCVPEGPFRISSPVPYTASNDVILHEVIRITCELCIKLEKGADLVAVPIPSEPYEYWDEKKCEGKGMLSLKHAGHVAGLGVLGKNTLLTNSKYGNRIILGAVLLNITLEGDQIADYQFCTENCQLCIEACSVHAIDGLTVNQKLCRDNSMLVTKKGYSLFVCNECRRVCPNGTGIRISEEL